MDLKVKKTPYSLTGKLLLTIGCLMVVVSSIFWYLLTAYQEKELIKSFVVYGTSFADNIRKSTRYGMLTSKPLLIQQSVEAVASTEGILKVRVVNCRGKIAYSSIKEEVGSVVEQKSHVCNSYYPSGNPDLMPKWSIAKNAGGYRTLNIIQPIYNEAACYTASCHVHHKEQRMLGFVESGFSLALLDKTIKQQSLAIAAFVLIFLAVISVVLCSILWKLVSTPVSMLVDGMQRVAAGNLEYKVTINTRDEMGELAQSFNAMTLELSRAKGELIAWGTMLEKRVGEKTEMIKNAQAQLIQSEKLASLGRMAAGVAHEINNPLTGVVTFGHLLLNTLAAGSQERKDVEVIIEQANRCSNIIKGLLGFSRATSTEKAEVNINDLLKTTLDIVKHKADFFNIQIVTRLDESIPPVWAGGLQLEQVFINMIMNAADAMEGEGTLIISTRRIMDNNREFAEVEFNDTGYGISEKDLPNIFEPFFTTKPVGKGTGLGLAVSHGIIEDHGGTILVKSEVEKGTSFFIRLPLHNGGHE
jgi:two-component system NtrC family sensor kinase